MIKTRIFIIRHGESDYNVKDIVSGGGTNPPLTSRGRDQIRLAREKLSHIKFDVAYSSDLQRAADTAEIVFGEPVKDKNKIAELRERYFGELEGKSNSILRSGNDEKEKLPQSERWHYKYVPDMESDFELATRYISTIENIAESNQGKTVLIGAHGTAIRVMLIMLQNLTHDAMPRDSIGNGTYAELSYSDEGIEVISVTSLT